MWAGIFVKYIHMCISNNNNNNNCQMIDSIRNSHQITRMRRHIFLSNVEKCIEAYVTRKDWEIQIKSRQRSQTEEMKVYPHKWKSVWVVWGVRCLLLVKWQQRQVCKAKGNLVSEVCSDNGTFPLVICQHFPVFRKQLRFTLAWSCRDLNRHAHR